MSKHDEAISEGASPEAVTPSIEVGEMVEVLEGLEAGARLQSTHVMPADASRSAKEIADHYQKIRSLLLSLDAERGRLRTALKPFAEFADVVGIPDGWSDSDKIEICFENTLLELIEVADFRRARSALGGV